ncbi:MAG: glycosyltransferase family 39 protein [Candidatus Alcyoniella australis]|nr:glycosyltransferase family 39 protein [Candidatus Alcyoniella australis]
MIRLSMLGDLGAPAILRGFALVALVLLGSAGIGRFLRKRMIAKAIPAQNSIDIALGLGLWGLICQFYGLFVGVGRSSALVLLIVLAALGAPSLGRALRWVVRANKSRGPLLGALASGPLFDRLLGLSILIVSSWTVLAALTPEIEPDALAYHLQLPRLWHEQGRIFLPYDLYMAGYPLLAETLFWPLWSLGAPLAAKWLHLAAGLVVVMGVIDFSAALHGRRAGLLAGLLLVSVPGWIWSSTTANVDLMLCLFVWAAVVLVLLRELECGRGVLLLAGICAGLALNVKVTAVIFVAPLFVLAAGLSLRRSRLNYGKRKILIALFDLALAALPAVALFMLWPLKNWLLGVPALYPAAIDPWRAGCTVLRIAQHPWCAAGPNCELWCEDAALVTFIKVQLLNLFGMGKDAAGFALLPWNLTLHPEKFGGVPLGLAWLPLWALVLGLRKPDVGSVSLLFASALGFVAWSLGSQQSRLLLPLLPLCATPLVLPLAQPALLRMGKGSAKLISTIFSALLVAAAVAGLPAIYPLLYGDPLFKTQSALTVFERRAPLELLVSHAHNDALSLLLSAEQVVAADEAVLTSGVEEYLYTDLELISPSHSPRAFGVEYELRNGSCDRAQELLQLHRLRYAISRNDEAAERFGRCAVEFKPLLQTRHSGYSLFELNPGGQ